MNIFLASDIHYECLGTREAVPVPEKTEIVVLAGDISYMPSALEIAGATADKSGVPVIFVPGNHEFYEHDYQKMVDLANIYEHENVHVLINKSVIINHIKFVGTTLWTNFEAFGDQSANMMIAERHIYDFAAIRYRGKLLKASEMLKLHAEARRFIESELKQAFEGKTVVVTHFPPSYKLCHSKFQGSDVSPYFNAACDDLIEKYRPDAWFYGHTHAPVEREIHGVPMYCNMGGYPREDGVGFDPDRIIEIPSDLRFYDSPFHVTHDEEIAAEMVAKEDQILSAKGDKPDHPQDFIKRFFKAGAESSDDLTEYQLSILENDDFDASIDAYENASKPNAALKSAVFEVVLKTAMNVMSEWSLTDQEQQRLLEQPNQLITCSRLIGIYRSLKMIFREFQRDSQWLRKPNTALSGRAALEVMLESAEGLERVQQYLQKQIT